MSKVVHLAELRKSRAERIMIHLLKKYADEICDYCANYIECKGEGCECYIEGVGDTEGKYPDLQWTCVDFVHGTCDKLRETPCSRCFDNNYSGFSWHGREVSDV